MQIKSAILATGAQASLLALSARFGAKKPVCCVKLDKNEIFVRGGHSRTTKLGVNNVWFALKPRSMQARMLALQSLVGEFRIPILI